MKFLKLCAGFSLAVLASVSVNVSAQTAACTWTSVYGSTVNGISTVSFICRNSAATVIASRTDSKYTWQSNYTCGTPSIMSGYQKTGAKEGSHYPLICNDVIVSSQTSSSSSTIPVSSSSISSSSSSANVCYSGASQIIYTSPGSTPFNPSFCGPQPQCGYTVTPLDNHTYPRLKYTCK